MQVIPDAREDVAENVADDDRDEDDRNGRGEVKRSDDKRHGYHVRPKTEVDDRLRPAERDENSPYNMHEAEKLSEREPRFNRIQVIHTDDVMANASIIPGRGPKSNRLDKRETK